MKEINAGNFEEEVINSKELVLVDYWGEDCQPCAKFMPIFEELDAELGDKIKFCKVNVNENRKIAISQRVMLLPTIVLYKNGERIEFARGGDASRDGVMQMIEKHR